MADERTARERIRDAALELFAEAGVAATPVRAVAARAGVSTALVMHHFGSKDALRTACDEHVAATVRARKTASVGAGADPLAALRASGDGPPLLRYLARTLLDGAPQVADLVDEMVADAQVYTEAGVGTGVVRPTDFPRERAVVLTIWSLGSLVLHEHVSRLLGTDLLGDPRSTGGYTLPATEVLTRGVITEPSYQQVRAAFAALDAERTAPDQETPDQETPHRGEGR
ncbi:TetR family transcriptional regulator [Pseudokineococcus sp. 1T1Z-3]|uniref:TetR family transcriptional regulator n=1 Tax=Pseudokineococcus sp. 1T1Z-3 TaxID=3132745 RepID=UPI0030B44F0C